MIYMRYVLSALALVVITNGPAFANSSGPQQLAQASAGSLQLKVKTICKNGDAYFQIINEGKEWPKAGKISLYRTNADTMVSQRRMRLKNGQKASFKVKKAAKTGAEIGLWVDPGWFKRPFKYDAKITCH